MRKILVLTAVLALMAFSSYAWAQQGGSGKKGGKAKSGSDTEVEAGNTAEQEKGTSTERRGSGDKKRQRMRDPGMHEGTTAERMMERRKMRESGSMEKGMDRSPRERGSRGRDREGRGRPQNERMGGPERMLESINERIVEENQKHMERKAKINRVQELLSEKGDEEGKAEAANLLDEENNRHEAQLNMLQQRKERINERIERDKQKEAEKAARQKMDEEAEKTDQDKDDGSEEAEDQTEGEEQ